MFEKFRSVWFFIAVIIAYVIEPVCKHFFNDFQYLNLVNFGIFVLVLFLVFLADRHLKTTYKEKHEYDYKIFFNSVEDIEQNDNNQVWWLRGLSDRTIAFSTKREDFDSSVKILSHQALMCRPFYKKAQKSYTSPVPHRYIIQCLFVPMDKNENTLLIRRKKKNHGSLMFGNTPENISFISFSPIPDHYGEKFDPEKAYHREVYRPDQNTGIYAKEIKELAVCVRQTNGNNYFFLIYKVKYTEVEFLKDGNTNYEIIEQIFGSRQENGELKKHSYFQKDNDLIEKAITFEELELLLPHDDKELKISSKTNFWHTCKLLFQGKIEYCRKRKFMEVEKKIIATILRDKRNNSR